MIILIGNLHRFRIWYWKVMKSFEISLGIKSFIFCWDNKLKEIINLRRKF